MIFNYLKPDELDFEAVDRDWVVSGYWWKKQKASSSSEFAERTRTRWQASKGR